MKRKRPSQTVLIPQDLAGCHALLEQLFRTVAEQQELLASKDRELLAKQVRIEDLLRARFGRRSERYKADPNQLLLDFPGVPGIESIAEGLADAVDDLRELNVAAPELAAAPIEPEPIATKVRKPRKRRAEQLPAHLPRREEAVEVPEGVSRCGIHGARQQIGEDVIETLVYVPAELYVRVQRLPKFACVGHAECGVASPARPVGLVEGNRYDTSIAAQIITAKYGFHLPIYRQQELFSAAGWIAQRGTLLNILRAAGDVVKPFIEHLVKRVLRTGPVGTDDTTVTLLLPAQLPGIDPGNPRSQRVHEVLAAARESGQPSVTARMWAYRSVQEKLNVFDFTVSRHRDGPDQFLLNSGYEGTLISDCYTGYLTLDQRSGARIRHAACNAHARRKVHEARSNHPQLAATLLGIYQQLYDIEDRARGADLAGRRALRQTEGVAVWTRLCGVLESPQAKRLAPKDKMGEAVEYIRKHLAALRVYLDDPLVPIDNNDVEQLMKQVAVGRKNWLFVGSVEAGEQAAMLMTLTSSALWNDLHVETYIKAVLDTLLAGSTDYDALAPEAWAKTHPEAIRAYRQTEREERQAAKTHWRELRRSAETEQPGE